jgi:hypothetical protein
MSESNQAGQGRSDVESTEKARRGIAQVETGDAEGVAQIDDARTSDPAGVDAIEQEAADGPAGRGLSR